MLKHMLLCFLVVVSFSSFAQDDIKQVQLEKWLKVLSADDMGGRPAGTDYERKAAAYIAKHFKKAGLKTLPGNDGYFQKFKVSKFEMVRSSLVLNGEAVAPENLVVSCERESVNVKDLSTFKVFHLGNDQASMRKVGNEARAYKGAKLIIFGTGLKGMFERYKQFLSRSAMTFEPNAETLDVYVLSDVTDLKSVELSAENKISQVEMANVVGLLPGSDPSLGRLMFSAHYDHIGTDAAPKDGDTIANGADDDGSGTVAVMALAKHYAKLANNKRDILFVAFTAEELGGFGSRYMAKSIKPETIAAGVNIEMIGKPTKWGKGHLYLTGFELTSMGKILSEASDGHVHADDMPEQNLFYRSDNASFARFGVPAHTLGGGVITEDIYYHTVDDEIETLDMSVLTEAVRLIARATKGLADGSATPTRLEPQD